MKLTIDNIKKENYDCFNYPNKEFKKITIDNVKYNMTKDINIEFDSIRETEDFICELIREYLTGDDLYNLLGTEFFKGQNDD